MSTAEARRRATEARNCLLARPPIDPRQHIAAQEATGMTIAELIEDYAKLYMAPRHALPADHKDRLRSADVRKQVLERDVVPIIGHVRLGALSKDDVARVIDAKMAAGYNVQARRVHMMLHHLFKWAVGRGKLEINPMTGMDRPPDNSPRTRVLSGPEIKILWHDAPRAFAAKNKSSEAPLWTAYARILRLCLCTAARVGEVAGIDRAELDLAAKMWTLPAARSKNKHEHALPLSSLALEVLEEALADAGNSRFVFPSRDRSTAMPSSTVTAQVWGLPETLGIKHFSSHDLRRTAADGLADLEVNPLTIAHILNHRTITKSTVTTKHYIHRTYEREMREALELWAGRVRSFIAW